MSLPERNDAPLDVIPCMSPCRGDHLIIRSDRMSGVWSLRIPAVLNSGPFLLIVRTRRIVTADEAGE